MNRTTWIAVAAACLALGLAPAAFAQDKVFYYDPMTKKEVTIAGQITAESPSKITVKGTTRTLDVLVPNLRDVIYDVGEGKVRADYTEGRAADNRMNDPKMAGMAADNYQKALKLYQDMLPELKEKPFAARHIEFLIAQLKARRAAEDLLLTKEAIEALTKFVGIYPDSWQLVRASKMLGELEEAAGNTAGAIAAYEPLARLPDLPKDAKLEYTVLLARLEMRTGKHASAKDRLARLMKDLPPGDAQTLRAQVYLAECDVAAKKFTEAETALRTILNGTADAGVKGAAANALGDSLRLSGKPEEAFWQYLWVDQVYNTDKNEHARALYHLWKLFAQVKNDAARAEGCKERLLKDKDFAGLDYQKRAEREDKAGGMK